MQEEKPNTPARPAPHRARKRHRPIPVPGDLPAPPSNRIIGRIVSDDSVRQKALEVQRAAQAQKKKEEQEAFLTAYRDSFALPHIAAKKCRISVTKHNQWFSTDMDYRRRAEEIKEFCAEHLQAKMYKSALAGDGQMLRYLDQRRIAAEQSAALKIAVEHSGTVGCSFTSEEDMKEDRVHCASHGTYPENACRLRPGSAAADSCRPERNTGQGPGPQKNGEEAFGEA